MSGDRMTDAEFRERILDVVGERNAGLRAAADAQRRNLLRIAAEVAAFRAATPGASANSVVREIRGKREDVLEAVRQLAEAEKRFEGLRNRLPHAAPDLDGSLEPHVDVNEAG
jgi:hypothetical protein